MFGFENTALIAAAKSGHVYKMKALVEDGKGCVMDKAFCSSHASSLPLFHAAINGRMQAVQWLMQNGASEENGMVALEQAAAFGHIAIVRWLLKTIIYRDLSRINAAMLRAVANHHYTTAQFLLKDGGASINACTIPQEDTALMIAGCSGNLPFFKWLLTFGGGKLTEATNRDNKTVLWVIMDSLAANRDRRVEKGDIILFLLDTRYFTADAVWNCFTSFPSIMIDFPSTMILPRTAAAYKPSSLFITILMSCEPPIEFYQRIAWLTPTCVKFAETMCARAFTLRQRQPEWVVKKVGIVTKQTALPSVVARIIVLYSPPCEIEMWCTPRRNPERATRKRRAS